VLAVGVCSGSREPKLFGGLTKSRAALAPRGGYPARRSPIHRLCESLPNWYFGRREAASADAFCLFLGGPELFVGLAALGAKRFGYSGSRLAAIVAMVGWERHLRSPAWCKSCLGTGGGQDGGMGLAGTSDGVDLDPSRIIRTLDGRRGGQQCPACSFLSGTLVNCQWC